MRNREREREREQVDRELDWEKSASDTTDWGRWVRIFCGAREQQR